ncbi:hypothetical protein WJX84_010473 [Apatococcus fuscideae]|uniref:Secreted protein n=1 Tax=Apatococcus fuscideae TaxID=2026836 RepID=A0AAW1T3R8_9CHLO
MPPRAALNRCTGNLLPLASAPTACAAGPALAKWCHFRAGAAPGQVASQGPIWGGRSPPSHDQMRRESAASMLSSSRRPAFAGRAPTWASSSGRITPGWRGHVGIRRTAELCLAHGHE